MSEPTCTVVFHTTSSVPVTVTGVTQERLNKITALLNAYFKDETKDKLLTVNNPSTGTIVIALPHVVWIAIGPEAVL